MEMVMLLLAVIITIAPVGAIVAVSLASRREDRAWSLAGPARSQADAVARRILDFHAEGTWPLPRSRRPVRQPRRAAAAISSAPEGGDGWKRMASRSSSWRSPGCLRGVPSNTGTGIGG
jgi:hypothetical protein